MSNHEIQEKVYLEEIVTFFTIKAILKIWVRIHPKKLEKKEKTQKDIRKGNQLRYELIIMK